MKGFQIYYKKVGTKRWKKFSSGQRFSNYDYARNYAVDVRLKLGLKYEVEVRTIQMSRKEFLSQLAHEGIFRGW